MPREAKIALILILLLIVLGTLLSIFIYLYWRKNKLTKYKNQIDEWTKKIKNTDNNLVTTINRFQAISTNQKDFETKLATLKRISNKMDKLIYSLNDSFKDIREAIEKYKVKEATKLINKCEPQYNEYLAKAGEFSEISDMLNFHWNTIDSVAGDSFEVLRRLEEYINNNTSRFSLSHGALINELQKLRDETSVFEAAKTKGKIADVSNKLNEHEKRIRLFVDKVDHFARLEWSIFYDLPELLSGLKDKKNQFVEIETLDKDYQEITKTWLKLPYQEVIENVRKIYFTYYLIDKKVYLTYEWKNYLIQNWKEYEKLFNSLETKVDSIVLLVDDDKKVDNLVKQFASLKEEFLTYKNKYKNEIIPYLDFAAFIDKLISIISEINGYIKDYESIQSQKAFDQYYIEINQAWFLRISILKSILEQNNELDSKMQELIRLNSRVQKEFEKNGKNNYETKTWIRYNELMNNLYQECYTAYIYKKMTEELINRLTIHRINNEELNEILLMVNKNLVAKKYKEAYELIASYLTKDKKYVL